MTFALGDMVNRGDRERYEFAHRTLLSVFGTLDEREVEGYIYALEVSANQALMLMRTGGLGVLNSTGLLDGDCSMQGANGSAAGAAGAAASASASAPSGPGVNASSGGGGAPSDGGKWYPEGGFGVKRGVDEATGAPYNRGSSKVSEASLGVVQPPAPLLPALGRLANVIGVDKRVAVVWVGRLRTPFFWELVTGSALWKWSLFSLGGGPHSHRRAAHLSLL